MREADDIEAVRARRREYNARNRERIEAYRKRYNDEHRDEINEKQRLRRIAQRAEREATEYSLPALDDAYAALYHTLVQRRILKRRLSNG